MGWVTTAVDSDCSLWAASLALDAAGNPHICYSSKYARWTGSAWKIETVNVGRITTFALDTNGNPHIYSGSKYAKWTGTEWAIVVYKDGPRGVYSIAVDPAGNPHIIFGNCSDGSEWCPNPRILKHAQYKT